MNTTTNISFKTMLLGMAILTTLCSSCSKKNQFLTSSVVPAARGFVKVKSDNNKNYVIQIQLSDLAEVSRLTPAKQTYVVWMVTDSDMTKNIGQIDSSTAFITKQLKASFQTVSSFKPIKIFITAEDNAAVQFPGNQIVLSTDKFTE